MVARKPWEEPSLPSCYPSYAVLEPRVLAHLKPMRWLMLAKACDTKPDIWNLISRETLWSRRELTPKIVP